MGILWIYAVIETDLEGSLGRNGSWWCDIGVVAGCSALHVRLIMDDDWVEDNQPPLVGTGFDG